MKTISTALAILLTPGLAATAPAQTVGAAPVRLVPAVGATNATKNVDLLAGKRVMILGDSITQDGTYVSYLEYFLTKSHPDKSFDIINVGLASETASGLSEQGHAGGAFPRPCIHERLQRALDALRPQVVVACYGMNDGTYQAYSAANMQAFVDGISKLAATCKAAGAQVILVTPPIFEGGDYDQVLGKFAEWEVTHPPKGVVAVADLHTAMNAARAERQKADPGYRFSGDNVHPGPLGHIVMAQAILQGLGIAMPRGSAEELQETARTDGLFNLVCQHRSNRSNGWLNYIGYTRERTVAPQTGDIEAVETAAKEIQAKIDAMKQTTENRK